MVWWRVSYEEVTNINFCEKRVKTDHTDSVLCNAKQVIDTRIINDFKMSSDVPSSFSLLTHKALNIACFDVDSSDYIYILA